MKSKFLLHFSTLFLSAFLLNSSVTAEDIPVPKVTEQVLKHMCGPAPVITNMLVQRYGEIPMFLGQSGVVIDPDENEIQGPIVIHVNPNTGSYTINILIDDVLCMLGSGEGMVNLTSSPPPSMEKPKDNETWVGPLDQFKDTDSNLTYL